MNIQIAYSLFVLIATIYVGLTFPFIAVVLLDVILLPILLVIVYGAES